MYCCKRVLEAAKLAYTITSQKLGSRDFWRIANSVLNKGKSATPPLFIGPEVLSSASDKARLFAENFPKNSNLDDLAKLPTAKNYCPASLLSVFSKVFEKLVSNRIFYHLEKWWLFSDFQYGFRSF